MIWAAAPVAAAKGIGHRVPAQEMARCTVVVVIKFSRDYNSFSRG